MTASSRKQVVILGAGPAGLTAAYSLYEHADVTLIELESQVGGISRTIVHNGNRMDIGGHRFFSKSETVMRWWQAILPLQGAPAKDDIALGRDVPLSDKPGAPDPEREDRVMLIRNRLSRIFYLRRFFSYPLTMSFNTIKSLGLLRMLRMGFSYIRACLFPIKPEQNLEDFLINRFGRELYQTFFKDYTEKVWGVPCKNISPEWGAQRIKGLSVTKVLLHAVKQLFSKDQSIEQHSTETSLIEQFSYPKFGPGQLWEEVASQVTAQGAKLLLQHEVVGLTTSGKQISAVQIKNLQTGQLSTLPCDAVISTIPLRELIPMLDAPDSVQNIAQGLEYRDFITVGVLLNKLGAKFCSPDSAENQIIRDNWLYIQEPDVYLGRIQIFNNWSPYLVADPQKVWLGLEYFATEGDALWSKSDRDFIDMAVDELCQLGFADKNDLIDATLLRVKKAYPAYFGSYDNMPELQQFLDGISNLYAVGRNGMHRYNNMDHSMLSAMEAAACILDAARDKSALWQINSEQEYHEQRSGE